MNKDSLLDKYLNGEGKLMRNCPKCSDITIMFDNEFIICLNGECSYQLRLLEGGNKHEGM